MNPDKATENFWREYMKVGEEVLAQGQAMGFGQSLIEVKFQNGTPSVLIRSMSLHSRYPDNVSAKAAIGAQLEQSEVDQFDGARTLTIIYNKGQINRLLTDDYENHILK